MLEDVKRLLEARKGAWATISEASGVPYDFVAGVGSGRYKNPGIKNLEKLFAYLKDN